MIIDEKDNEEAPCGLEIAERVFEKPASRQVQYLIGPSIVKREKREKGKDCGWSTGSDHPISNASKPEVWLLILVHTG